MDEVSDPWADFPPLSRLYNRFCSWAANESLDEQRKLAARVRMRVEEYERKGEVDE